MFSEVFCLMIELARSQFPEKNYRSELFVDCFRIKLQIMMMTRLVMNHTTSLFESSAVELQYVGIASILWPLITYEVVFNVYAELLPNIDCLKQPTVRDLIMCSNISNLRFSGIKKSQSRSLFNTDGSNLILMDCLLPPFVLLTLLYQGIRVLLDETHLKES